ncbi:hypothetical protein T484DRAFT_1758365 [Baffinella frigidus]|nr:hypothetical protein T484DRAFT_1758365 [Cryptophyta sp. CCMP2293]
MANTTPAIARIWEGLKEKYEKDIAPLEEDVRYWYRNEIDYDEHEQVNSLREVKEHVEFAVSQVTERAQKNRVAREKIPRMIAVNYDIMKLPNTTENIDLVAASMFYILFYCGTAWTTVQGIEDTFKTYMQLNWDTYANITSHGNYNEDDMVYQIFRISAEFNHHHLNPRSQGIEWRSLYPEYVHKYTPGQFVAEL